MRTVSPVVLCLAFAASMPGAAAVQVYPDKPIRMIAPWNPGGTSDTIARIIQVEADKFGKIIKATGAKVD